MVVRCVAQYGRRIQLYVVVQYQLSFSADVPTYLYNQFIQNQNMLNRPIDGFSKSKSILVGNKDPAS